MKINFLFKCILFGLIGCGPMQSRQEKRIGINGEAVYVFNKDGTLKSLAKEEYSTKDFTIFLLRDSLILGDTFKSIIFLTSPKNKININAPKPFEIKNDTVWRVEYTFLPDKEGVYDYSGTIEFDSTIVPFEYKFIVIDKDN